MRSPKGLLLGMVAVTGLTFLAGLTVLGDGAPVFTLDLNHLL